MKRLRYLLSFWSWPLEWGAGLLIPSWCDDGGPDDWRFACISWAWMREDRRHMPESYEPAAPGATPVDPGF